MTRQTNPSVIAFALNSRWPSRRRDPALEVLEDRIAPATLLALDDQNHLLSFDSATPGTVTTTSVTGLGAGETLVGIDFRPATGALYGLTKDGSNAGRLYAINANTGAASFGALLTADTVNDPTPTYANLAGTNFGFDFNPAADRLRVVSDTGASLRINVDTGKVITDGDLNPAGSLLAGSAYTNSFASAPSTSLFGIDVTGDRLVLQNPPNNGTLAAVGTGLGVNATGTGGFDIISARTSAGIVTDTAFAALTVGGVTGLYTIDLVAGTATSVGAINGATVLHGLTSPLAAPAPNAYTVDSSNNHLIRLNTAAPGAGIASNDLGAISNLGLNETIIGFDFRPANGLLYLATVDNTSVGHLYTVSTTNAAATPLGTIGTLNGTNYGVDFNPTADRLRVVSDAGQNLRINVDTLGVTTDGVLNGAANGATAVGYLNNFAGNAGTNLFYIDTTGVNDQLLSTTNPNGGVVATVGPLGVDAGAINGFDIAADGRAYAALNVSGTTSLYSINLTTGAATLVGGINGVTNSLGLAVATAGSFQISPVTPSVAEGAGSIVFTVTRTGASEGASTVLVKTTTGTAGTADFTTVSQLVSFSAGATTQQVTVPISQDILIEGTENFTVTLSDPLGGAQLASTNTSATVTITDDEPLIPATNLIGLNSANQLVLFSSTAPGTISSTVDVGGLGAGETLIGIDFRPATGALYGITKDGSNAGRLYAINPTTGAATFSALLVADAVNDPTPTYTGLSGANFGTDFNPAADRLRVVSDSGQNLRINVDTGGVITDADLNPGGSVINGAAYTNSFAGAPSTQLFNIDTASDFLKLQNPPNNGTLTNVGTGLGVDVTGVGGFDITTTRDAAGNPTNLGFAALTVNGVTGLYAVDVLGGNVSSFGAIGLGNAPLIGLTSSTGSAAGTPAAVGYSIDANNHLLKFSTAAPGASTDLGALTGLNANEVIIGFDFRPANGLAYLLTRSTIDNSGRIYSFAPASATPLALSAPLALTADTVNDPTPDYTALAGVNFGVDFNPVVDRLRVVSSMGENLRINVDTGKVITDVALNPGSPNAFAAAYTNSYAGVTAATGTTLYVLDATNDTLFIQAPPNNGTLTAVGTGLGVDASAVGGFDIRANGEAFAVLTVGGTAALYKIDLTAGTATVVGPVGAGLDSNGFSLATAGSAQFSVAATTVNEADGTVSITINRIGASEGVSTVLVKTMDATAIAGQDYTAVSRVVSFGPGVNSQTITVPILNDTTFEGATAETFLVSLSEPTNGLIPTGTGTVTESVAITDNDAAPIITVSNLSQAEGNGPGNSTFNVHLTLTNAASTDITLTYSTIAGSATTPGDFVAATNASFTILAGQTTADIPIMVVGDTVAEVSEAFMVQLQSLSANASFNSGGATATSNVTILNDDALTVTAKTVTYTDVDGDLVTLKITKGTLTGANLNFVPAGALGGVQLAGLTLTDATQFAKSNVTFTAKRSITLGGDGFVNVGYINATGNSLGVVSVPGDLGQIDAVNATTVTVQSIGKLGLSTQAAGGSLTSDFTGKLTTLTVKSDVRGAIIKATDLTSVNILGSLLGGAGDHSGSIEVTNRINALTIGHSLSAGSDPFSGSIIAKTTGALKIRNIDGGRVFISGNTITGGISAANTKLALALGSLTVAGNVNNANILVGYDRVGAPVNANVATGAITVSGDWEASNLVAGVQRAPGGFFGENTNSLIAGATTVVAKIASITVKGQIIGTLGSSADRFGFVAEQIAAFKVGATALPVRNLPPAAPGGGTPGTAGPDTFSVGATGDVFVREYFM